ncbi:MAG TPA: ECF RNA polymerase sigma factor SigK [Acidimicrobiia bacterium]
MARTPKSRGPVPGAGPVASQEELVLRAARGDQEAFGSFYDMVSAQVYGLARRVVRDPAQAEEVTQEVFVEAWRRAPEFDASLGSPTTWILTIAHRRSVDRVRSEEASRRREERLAQDPTSIDYDPVQETVELRLESQMVRRALAQLTEVQREAIELAYYRGFTYREVATLLDTPEGTIKTRIRDGLVRLRDTLGVAT